MSTSGVDIAISATVQRPVPNAPGKIEERDMAVMILASLALVCLTPVMFVLNGINGVVKEFGECLRDWSEL